jgi:hypothetical protein
VNTTPFFQPEPVAVIVVAGRPWTTSVTLDGARFFASVYVTWNANDVVGLPEPGAAPPTVSVERGVWLPQLAAATGDAVRTKATRLAASASPSDNARDSAAADRDGRNTLDGASLDSQVFIGNVRRPSEAVLGPIAGTGRYLRISRGPIA